MSDLAGAQAISLISWVFVPMWLTVAAMTWRSRPHRVWLRQLRVQDPPVGGWPSLSVIVAARNEAKAIRQALTSVMAQDYPALQIVVVNDRSDDGTGAILDEMGTMDRRLRIVHVAALPDGWLGKNHALQRGLAECTSTYVLLTDGDVVLARPDLLRRVMSYVTGEGIEHFTAMPDVPSHSLAERLFLMIFNIAFAVRFPIWAVHHPRMPVGMGVGAFNLVRRDALQTIGHLENLRLSIDEDMRLGQALKFAGFQTRVGLGRDEVVVRWQSGLWGYIKGLEKNFFASMDFSLWQSIPAIVGLTALTLSGVLSVLAPTPVAVVAGLLNLMLITAILREGEEQTGVPAWYALLLPLGGLVLNVAHINSIWQALRRDGVVWRDHHYHLDELRAHVRARNRWLRRLWKHRR